MNDKKIYFGGAALLLLSLLLHSCQAIIPDDIGQEKKSTTYLQFNMTSITMPGSVTRAQGDTPSINTDDKDYEDYVGELAVLVYDANTGMQVKAQFSTTPSFVMELEAKADTKYHFCFIANYPRAWRNTFMGLYHYSDLQAELKDKALFWGSDRKVLYDGATPQNLFPMARIYENQTVVKGGSFAAPVPFRATTAQVGSLSPISSWTTTKEHSITPSSINLIRTAAKIVVRLTGEGLGDVKSVELYNYREMHTYMEEQDGSYSSLFRPFKGHTEGQITTEPSKPWHSVMYIPENLLGKKSAHLYWDTGSDNPVGRLTYISIEMKAGKIYKVPVIVNGTIPIGGEYLDYARGNVVDFIPDYSIVRNHEYKFDIIVPAEPSELDLTINYRVKLWEVKNVPIEFD